MTYARGLIERPDNEGPCLVHAEQGMDAPKRKQGAETAPRQTALRRYFTVGKSYITNAVCWRKSATSARTP